MYRHKQLDWELRLFSKLLNVNGCLEWQGVIFKNGYGRVKKHGRHLSPHREVYKIVKGKIPNHLVIDHLCRNRKCANPDHLEIVTQRTNILRGVGSAALNFKKTHCKYGHKLTKKNIYSDPGRNIRRCRICIARRTKEWSLRNV